MVIDTLKAAGFKFDKKKWPTVTPAQLQTLGVTRADFAQETHPATIHETLGPLWKHGVILEIGKDNRRPYAFNK